MIIASHASLLVAAGVPIKVVSERLGPPGSRCPPTNNLWPGMGAATDSRFAELIDTSR
ncbi:MAG: hypothetical protein ACI8Y4_004887 [Candidatus Poriferisodalaceae bacterium]|jgi:hypothetical protein